MVQMVMVQRYIPVISQSHRYVKKHTKLKPNFEGILIYNNLLQRQVYLFILGIAVWINC